MVKSLDRQLEGNVWESIDTWRPREQARTVYISLECMMASSGTPVSHTSWFWEVQGRNSMGTQLLPRSTRWVSRSTKTWMIYFNLPRITMATLSLLSIKSHSFALWPNTQEREFWETLFNLAKFDTIENYHTDK